MRTCILAALVAPLVIACKAPPEAPADFTEIGGFLFQYFTDDEAILADGVQNMEVWLQANLDAKGEETVRDGYTVRELPLSVLASVRPDVEPESEDTIGGSSVATQSVFDVDTIALALSMAEQEEVFPTNFQSHERVFNSGEDCFPDKSCAFLDTDNTVESAFGGATPVLTVSTNSRSQYRWVRFGEDGEHVAMLNRTWLQEEAITGGVFGELVQIHEQLFLRAVIPWEGGAVIVGTAWVSASIIDIDENFALNQMIKAMKSDGESLDKYLAAQ